MVDLGSQNSSPATSPATYQATSNDEDSNGCSPSLSPLPLGTDGIPKASTTGHRRPKVFKHTRDKPAVTYTRFDHGKIECRRSSDSEPSSTTIIRHERRRSLSRTLGRKQVEAARAATPTSSVTSPATSQSNSQLPSPGSVTPTCPLSQPASPATLLLVVQQHSVSDESKESDGSVNKGNFSFSVYHCDEC